MCPAARGITSGAGQGSGQVTDPSSAFHLATASPWSHTTHRVHKRDAKDVVAEEEQLLLHQTPLVIYLDLLWQGAEGQGEVHPGVGRKVQVYTIPAVLAPDLQPGLLSLAAGKEVAFPILSELPCGQALGRWQLSRDTCVPSAGGSVGAASLPLLQLVWGRDSHAYHIPGRTWPSRSGYFETKSSPFQAISFHLWKSAREVGSDPLKKRLFTCLSQLPLSGRDPCVPVIQLHWA